MKFDSHQAIREKFEFGMLPEGTAAELNIAWGVDRNFMFGAGVSLTSILMHNQDMAIHFHLFTDHLDDDYKQRISQTAQAFNTRITLYVMHADEFKRLPCGNAWSYATYFRFIAFEYLSDKLDCLLYIDADVICKGSLKSLSQLVLGDNIAAVIKDIPESRVYAAKRLNISEFSDQYFNAGVIYANLTQWKKQNCLTAAFDMLMDKNNSFAFFDQDVLNILFKGQVIILPHIYDEIYGIKQELKSRDIQRYKETITDETILIHYVGVTKPWHSWANYPSAQFFISAYQSSAWSDVSLLGPVTPKQFKKKSRHERLQGKLGSAMLSYVGYLLAKFKSR